MDSRRIKRQKELEIISLIDIIFLLLIFSFVVIPGIDEPLPTLKIKLESLTGNKGDRVKVEIFDPDANLAYTTTFTQNDLNSVEFDDLDKCKKIKINIEEYLQGDKGDEHIIVEADDDIPFRVIDFIVRQCSASDDNALYLINKK